MTYKTIFWGRLEFGSSRSFEKAVELYQHRGEVYYKNDLAFQAEAIFPEESKKLDIPRCVLQTSDKTWKNSIHLLESVAQFALSGSIYGWRLEEGKALDRAFVEPQSDKQTVQAFLRGRQLAQGGEQVEEALALLRRAIDRFDRHAEALEQRAQLLFHLGERDAAERDFERSVAINPQLASAYWGGAQIALEQQHYDRAIAWLQNVVKNSIPLQPLHWEARRLKGECLLKTENYEQAAFELKLFTARSFGPENPNYSWRKKAFFDYGKTLLGMGAYDAAIEAFTQSMNIEIGEGCPSEKEPLLLRGIARKKAGKEEFAQDLQNAARWGSNRALRLLDETAV